MRKPSHGKTSTYQIHKCRCELCCKAQHEAARKGRIRKERGLTQSMSVYYITNEETQHEDKSLFTVNLYNTLHFSCVYVWRRGLVTLYVGATKSALSRLAVHHIIGRIEKIQSADVLDIYPTNTRDEREALEYKLIDELKPKYNKVVQIDGKLHNLGSRGAPPGRQHKMPTNYKPHNKITHGKKIQSEVMRLWELGYSVDIIAMRTRLGETSVYKILQMFGKKGAKKNDGSDDN